MSKGNTFENDLLKLIFNGDTIANLAIDATATPLTNLYASLHTADPGEGGSQTTNEASFGAYARVAIPRTSGGFSVSGNAASLATSVTFAECTGTGTQTVTYFGIGTASSGAGKLMYSGSLDVSRAISAGVTPRLTTGTTITED